MRQGEQTNSEATEYRELAEQARVEIAVLLNIEASLRLALQWMTRNRGNSRKLSTLRFQTWSFERQLARVHLLADHGGYLHRVTEAQPHLAAEVAALRNQRLTMRASLESILLRLEELSSNDSEAFAKLCGELSVLLDDLGKHGRAECDLLQHSFMQDEGGSG